MAESQSNKKCKKEITKKGRYNTEYCSFKPDFMPQIPCYHIPDELLTVMKNYSCQYPIMCHKHKRWLELLKIISEMDKIEERYYLMILKILLYIEDYYTELSMKKFTLKNQRIEKCNLKSFKIHVPGLCEGRPSLILGDIVEILEFKSKIYDSIIISIGMNYIIVKFMTKEFYKAFKKTKRYDIRFHSQRWTIRVSHYAIDLAIKFQLTSLLYPIDRIVYNKPSEDLIWFDENIKGNPEQMQAVKSILGRTAYPSPYILFGPPGTGKTATIVETIFQIFNADIKNRILICTPSNSAADNVTKRLLRIIPENMIYRMYGSSKDWRDVDPDIIECSNFIDDEVVFIPKDIFIRKNVIVTTLVSCIRLASMNLRKNHFSHIFIDEAGQATQPETLIPFGLMSGNNYIGRLHAQIIMSGDPKQLGPIVMTKFGQDILGKSMLERFIDNFKIYQRDSDDKYNPNFLTKLVKNYRSHKAILHIPNQLFYNDELESCGGERVKRAENWQELTNKAFPVLFHAVHGLESRKKNSSSVCNESEVEIVINYVTSLVGIELGGLELKQEDIGIITPFRLQRSIISDVLKNKGMSDVFVGTVENFQGQERDVIILSTVRSALFEHDGRFHIGFLSHEKRFNVAITRAKSLLIVVGNPKVLQIDKCWREFIKYCQDNGACKGDSFILSDMTEVEMKKFLHDRNKIEHSQTVDSLTFDEYKIQKEKVNLLSENNISRRERKFSGDETSRSKPEKSVIFNYKTDSDVHCHSASRSSSEIVTGEKRGSIGDEDSSSYSSSFSRRFFCFRKRCDRKYAWKNDYDELFEFEKQLGKLIIDLPALSLLQ